MQEFQNIDWELVKIEEYNLLPFTTIIKYKDKIKYN